MYVSIAVQHRILTSHVYVYEYALYLSFYLRPIFLVFAPNHRKPLKDKTFYLIFYQYPLSVAIFRSSS